MVKVSKNFRFTPETLEKLDVLIAAQEEMVKDQLPNYKTNRTEMIEFLVSVAYSNLMKKKGDIK